MFVRRRRRRDARGQAFRILAAVYMDDSHMFVRRRRRRDARGQAFRILAAVSMDVSHMFVRRRRRRDARVQAFRVRNGSSIYEKIESVLVSGPASSCLRRTRISQVRH